MTPAARAGGEADEPPVWPQRLWSRVNRDPEVLAIVAYLLVALLVAVAAYYALFSQFAPYDDEGSLLLTLKPFVAGHVLYRDIFTPFGPFFYEFFGGIFKVFGIGITNDASRTMITCLWTLACLLFGLAVHRLSGRLVLGLAAMVVAFPALAFLAKEPMHPEGLSILLLALFAFLMTFAPRPGRISFAALGAGAVLAALVLTKINVGSLATIAVPVAAVLTVGPLYRRRWLRWPVLVLFLVVPVAIMARDLNEEWGREFVAIEVLAMLALYVAAWRVRPLPGDEDRDGMRWVLTALAGFVAMAVVVLAIMIATGVGLADAWHGMITQAFKVPDTLVNPFFLQSTAVLWGVAAVTGAAIVVWGASRGGAASAGPGILRLLAGLAIWLCVAGLSPIPLSTLPESAAIPLVLAWVALVPPRARQVGSHERLARAVLAAVAVAEVIQAYPVAGSQVNVAAATFVPVGGICLWDGYESLREWATSRGENPLRRLTAIGVVGALGLVVACGYAGIVRPAAANVVSYANGESIGLPGATQIRAPVGVGITYRDLVELVDEHECTMLVGYPSVNSLYLWTGMEPPPPGLFDPWMLFLDDAGQSRIVRQLEATPRPCAIRNEEIAQTWLGFTPRVHKPLVDYIFQQFKPVAIVGSYTFETPRAEAG